MYITIVRVNKQDYRNVTGHRVTPEKVFELLDKTNHDRVIIYNKFGKRLNTSEIYLELFDMFVAESKLSKLA